MRNIGILLVALLAVAIIAPLAFTASAPVGFPILIDLSHGQPSKGIEIIMKNVPEAEWYILVKSEEQIEHLHPIVKSLAHGILVGGFTNINLEKLRITMIIIGQPQVPFTAEEVAVIASWFTARPGRALWLAADSDYPAQGSETSQQAANIILEAIGAKLRMDYVSIEDSKSNALRGYRVVAIVNPDPEVAFLGYAAEKVLFHGPGGVAWVDDAGNWHKVTKNDKPANVYIIATTTENGLVVEHQAAPKGVTGKAYKPGETGVFTLMAAEKIKVGTGENVVIVSGESPYGGYQPMATWLYYGIHLDGPRFVRNVILWATGYMGELKEYAKIAALPKEVETRMEDVVKKVMQAMGTVNTYAMAALGLAVLALIIALVGVVLATKKK